MNMSSAVGRFAVALAVTGLILTSCAKDPTGTVRVTAAGATTVYLTMDTPGGGATKFDQPNFEAAVEVGSYRPRMLVLQAMQGGDAWRMTGAGPWGSLHAITVKEKATTEIKVGPPITLTPTVQANDPVVGIGLQVTGKMGESYSPSVTKNGVAGPLKVTIVGKDGKELSSGKFEFG
jgi:hypothetical protein